jgi:hypothetical protein
MTTHIIPRYKLILYYDLALGDTEAYYQFVMTEMVPALQEMGLYLFRAFHNIPGQNGDDIRVRQVEYVAEDLETIRDILNSDKWEELEHRLLEHVTHYSRKVVRFKSGFQL